MSQKTIYYMIVLIIVIALGFFVVQSTHQTTKQPADVDKNLAGTPLPTAINTPAPAKTTFVQGVVTALSIRSITLSKNGKEISFVIGEKLQVEKTTPDGKSVKTAFSDIAVGKNVAIVADEVTHTALSIVVLQ